MRLKFTCLLIFALLGSAPSAFGERFYVATDIYSTAEPSALADSRQASSLFQQAREACEKGDVGSALRLVAQTLVVDPDHLGTRRVLGYRRAGDTWAGNYAARRLARGEIWHAQYGWIRAEDVERWNAGERPLGKRWISEADDARRHATIANGWQIRTDHFRVVTNHSRQEAARLATRLEELYQIWQQQFGGFYLSPEELLKRFDGKESNSSRGKPFQVVYYKTRDEYNAALLRHQPRIEMTLGIYFDATRTTHFFAGGYDKDDGQDAGTIYHEAVHQFFQESTRSARSVGALANAWVIEGVACYFESLVEHEDPKTGRYFTLGSPAAGRLPAARHRQLVNDYYVPLAELSALGMTDLQRRDDIARLYSQSAGLATFLMHYKDGQYRPALVQLLQLVYTGRDKMGTLEDLTGSTFTQLDQEYREFLEQQVSEAPVSEAPVSEASVSEAPVSEAPVSEASVSEATGP